MFHYGELSFYFQTSDVGEGCGVFGHVGACAEEGARLNVWKQTAMIAGYSNLGRLVRFETETVALATFLVSHTDHTVSASHTSGFIWVWWS